MPYGPVHCGRVFTLFLHTITVLDWVLVFIEARYIDSLVDSLNYSRTHKGLRPFTIVVMPNHLHLITAAEDVHAMVRDFKWFTSRTIHGRLKEDRRETVLDWLDRAAQRARRGRGEFSMWQDGFHSQGISTRPFLEQKLHYLHENPVRKGFVAAPEDWWFSPAAWFAERREVCMAMNLLEF